MRVNSRKEEYMNWQDKWEDFTIEVEYYTDKFIRTPYYNMKYFIKNLWKYRSILWNDRDWDYIYIHKLLYHKLKWTKETMVDGHCEHRANTIRNIDIAIESLRRCVEHDYLVDDNPFYDKMREISPKSYLYSVEEFKRMSEKKQKLYWDYIKRSSQHQAQMEKQNIRLAYGTIQKHITKWWD
jgi:hypothetical protein